MARTLNVAEHTVRRDAFVEAAQRLMASKGFEQMSIQDVLDAVEASRGAFYHYFDSKQALLEAVIERMVDTGLAEVAPLASDPSLPAGARLRSVFGGIGRWKTERKQLVLALLEVWLSDDNAIVREKFRRSMSGRLADVIAPIIQEGIDQGEFHAASARAAASVVVILLLGFQDVAIDLFLKRQAGRIALEDVEATLRMYTESIERILGAQAGSIDLIDPTVLHAWFG